jgi:DNA polymerase I-like protein with 3'-5' exonuclease and polymerase domains
MTTGNGFPATVREAALYYLGRGLSPIPVPARTKKPLLTEWQNLRLTRDDIDQHFPAGKPLNIGLLTGCVNGDAGGEVVVDVDCPEALRAADLILPETDRTAGRPGNSQSHRHFRVSVAPSKAHDKYKDPTIKDDTDKRRCLVELLSTGAQVIAPPSVHDKVDETYTWHSFGEPADVDAGELLTKVKRLAAVALLGRYWPKGARHDAVLALAGGLLNAGLAIEDAKVVIEAVCRAALDDEVKDRLRAVDSTADALAEGKNTTGWPTLAKLLGNDVVDQVLDWLGIKAPVKVKARIRHIEPYQPFPTGALPEPLLSYVVQVAEAIGCDPAFVALPALSVVASAIGNTRTIRLRGGWSEPSVIWTVIIGDSGTLKTPAYKMCVRHLFTIQKGKLTEYRVALVAYKTDLDRWKQSKKGNPENAGDPPEEPVLGRVICSDVTIEKLAEILEDNDRGILVAREELSGWLSSYQRYKGQKGGSDLPNWLEAYQAGTWIVDRKSGDRKHYFVHPATVSVTGTIQPGTLARVLTPELLDSGLAARLLMAMPDKRTKVWTEAEVAPATEAAYHELLDKLLDLDFKSAQGDEPEPHVLRLLPGAKQAWVQFYKEWAEEQAAAEGELAAALSKLEGAAARFALLHHVISHVGRGEDDTQGIRTESVEAGVVLCRWFACEARRVLSIVTESNEERDARRLVEFIRAHGGEISVKQLQRSNQRKYPSSEAATAALEHLVGLGLGRWVDRLAGIRGGRPTRLFVLSTLCDETDEPPHPGSDFDGRTAPRSGDETPRGGDDTGDDTPKNNGRGEVSSVSSYVTHNPEASNNGTGHGSEGREVSSHTPTEVSSRMAVVNITDPAQLPAVASAVGDSTLVGLDIETTGLNPRTDRARLLTLACDTVDGGIAIYIVDLFALDPAPLWEALSSVPIVGHNLQFDLGFLARLGFVPGVCHDTLLASQLLHAGDPAVRGHKLADCCQRELGEAVSKEEQASDWSGTLTPQQFAYAAKDADIVRRLHTVLTTKIADAKLTEAVAIENAALPAVAWLSGAGVGFDRNAWQALTVEAKAEAERLTAELDRLAPPRPQEFFGSGWKWDSPKDIMTALALAGCGGLKNTADDTLAALDHPLAALLRDYRAATKRSTTYGSTWLKGSYHDGRVYAGWHQLGAGSGRMSCSKPNLQNLPRDIRYRQCFTAPPGRVLVKADYSQIELRLAAKIADDGFMQKVYACGHDLHTKTARLLLGKEEVTKGDRQLAKAVNFGLLYGMGPHTLRVYARTNYGVEMTPEQASKYRSAFFAAYPGLRRWHAKAGRSKETPLETRTLAGRRRHTVLRFTEKLNTPVQGTGADGLKRALGLLWERRDQCPGAVPVLVVHDEIVVEADADKAEAAAVWLKQAMVDGMAPLAAPVPVEVEVKIGPSWGA